MLQRRAVTASLNGGEALAEALMGAHVATVAHGRDGLAALELVRAHQPDVVLADAVLPRLDGVALAARIAGMPLQVRPAVLLARRRGLAPTACPDAAVLDWPPTPEAIQWALRRANERAGELPPAKADRLNGLMDALGLPAHIGRECLKRAVALAWRDRRRLDALRRDLYPAAGQPFGLTGAQAERAIRHAIDAAWRGGAIDRQNQIFGNTIDARRGRPTCGEMIAQLAELLRWEGI